MKTKIALREIAQPRGWNQKRLARATNLELNLISRYWHNNSSSVQLRAIDTLARTIGVNPGDLLQFCPDAPANEGGV